MAAIIFDVTQDEAVNLDNVDSITYDGHKIFFMKRLSEGSKGVSVVITVWEYSNEAEGQDKYEDILEKYGRQIVSE